MTVIMFIVQCLYTQIEKITLAALPEAKQTCIITVSLGENFCFATFLGFLKLVRRTQKGLTTRENKNGQILGIKKYFSFCHDSRNDFEFLFIVDDESAKSLNGLKFEPD